MLAGAPKADVSIQSDYPPLDSWKSEGDNYRHNSTSQLARRLPKGGVLNKSSAAAGISQQPSTEKGESSKSAAKQTEKDIPTTDST